MTTHAGGRNDRHSCSARAAGLWEVARQLRDAGWQVRGLKRA